MVSDTKIDNNFPVCTFVIDGLSTPYWLGRDSNSVGIMLYFRENIPSNFLVADEKKTQSFFVESNEKWLISCSYNPNKTDLQSSRCVEYIPGSIFCNI